VTPQPGRAVTKSPVDDDGVPAATEAWDGISYAVVVRICPSAVAIAAVAARITVRRELR
jgi:hypothetical protein